LSIQVLLIENTNVWYVSRSLHIALRLPDLIILLKVVPKPEINEHIAFKSFAFYSASFKNQ